MPNVPLSERSASRTSFRSPFAHGAIAPSWQRQRLVGHDAGRIEIVHGSEPLAVGAGAVRRVERERARRHLGHADAAVRAREPARKQPIAAVERVDDDDVVGQVERDLDGLGQPPLDAGLQHEAVHDDFDRVVLAPVELDVLLEGAELAVDADLREAARAQGGELLLELPLAAAHDRRQHVDALVVGRQHHHVDDAIERLRGNRAPAEMAVREADVGEQQPQVVVDFGDGADGGARVRAGRFLLDRDRRRQAVDQIDVRLLHLLEELPRVRRQRLDVAALAFRVNRVEGERRFPRAGQAGDDDQPIARDVDVDILEVVYARAAHRNPVVRHRYSSKIPEELKQVF